jgi:hypothetical protein
MLFFLRHDIQYNDTSVVVTIVRNVILLNYVALSFYGRHFSALNGTLIEAAL